MCHKSLNPSTFLLATSEKCTLFKILIKIFHFSELLEKLLDCTVAVVYMQNLVKDNNASQDVKTLESRYTQLIVIKAGFY